MYQNNFLGTLPFPWILLTYTKPVCLFVRLSVCPSVCLSICLFVPLLYFSVCLFVHLSVCPSVFLVSSVCLSVCLWPSFCFYICLCPLPACPYICESVVCFSVCLFIYLSFCLCLYHCLHQYGIFLLLNSAWNNVTFTSVNLSLTDSQLQWQCSVLTNKKHISELKFKLWTLNLPVLWFNLRSQIFEKFILLLFFWNIPSMFVFFLL